MSGFLEELASGVRRLQTISKDLSEVELKDAVLEQKKLLLDAKEEILELREVISKLKETQQSNDDRAAFEAGLVSVSGFKYDAVDGNPSGLPYCPKCEVSEGKFYRLSRGNDQFSTCPNCEVVHNAAQDGRVNLDNPAFHGRIETHWDPLDPY